jgi:Chaperone of endosialidase
MSDQKIDGNLHVNSPSNPAVLKVQSAGAFGAARVEFWSDPVGSNTEWRPGFIQSTDQAGGTWTGGLAFYVNGTGLANKTAAVEVMRLTQNLVGIGTATPKSKVHVQGGEIFSGGSAGGLSFGDRGVADYVGSISMGADGGQRWTWYSNGFKARLWSGTDKMNVDTAGNVQITGNFISGCSKEYKEDITKLTLQEAMKVLHGLNPVKFQYKADPNQNVNVGFIAEDVPDLLATSDRKGLSTMDVVAVLTKVIQEQQRELTALSERVSMLPA